MAHSDPTYKRLMRAGYGATLGLHALLSGGRGDAVRVYYGGARAGDVGGPLVKVKRLREHFPEDRWGYTLVYALSNAPYLPSFALRLLRRRGIPVVHNQNGVFYPAWFDGDWKAQNARMARSYHLADHVFYQSEFCRRAADRFLGQRQGPGEILYNAVDTGHFRPATEETPARPFTFLLTGKIGNHLFYRLESTIRGLALARRGGLDVALTVAGWVEAEVLARSRALAAELGVADAVRFIGRYTQAGAPAVYQGADAYVMTKHNDPCPNTVLEALACGLPVLYSASGGVPELVGDEAGIGLDCPEDWETVHTPGAEAIAAGMGAVAERHSGMAAAARRRAVERFDIAHWLERHAAVFTRLVEARA